MRAREDEGGWRAPVRGGRWALIVGMWLAIAVGVYARVRGLGLWPLAIDEYFVLESVGNIIQHGIPAYSCGGYYLRGLTLQYLIAPLYASGLSAELSGRLVTVVCSFAVLPAVYLLGKRMSGLVVACLAVALLSLSLWEIEFARFARMYMPFQAVFVWYLLALERAVTNGRRLDYIGMWVLSGIGVVTWEGGLFLLLVNFVPGLMGRRPAIAPLLVSAGLLVLGYLYSAVNFRFLGGPPPFPSDVTITTGGSPFLLPPLLASTLLGHPLWLFGALAVVVFAIWALVRLWGAPGDARERFAWAVLIVLALGNLFGCVLIALVLALLTRWIDIRHFERRTARLGLLLVAACFVFWLAYVSMTTEWYRLIPGFRPGSGLGGELSKVLVGLFKYPNIFDSMLFQWLGTIPVLTGLLGALAALAGLWAIITTDERRSVSIRVAIVACLIMVAMVGVVETKYTKTRYTFFLLPVFYLLALTAIHEMFVRRWRSDWQRGLTMGVAVVAIMGLTEDFGWAHLRYIDSAEQNYRLAYDPQLAMHYYPRYDYRTAAEYVNLRTRPEDVVIITRLPIDYYLARTDYVYRNYRELEFASVSCDRGQRERWTGSRLLYRSDDLFRVIDRAPAAVWLVIRTPRDGFLIDALRQKYTVNRLYSGLADRITVFRIDGVSRGALTKGQLSQRQP